MAGNRHSIPVAIDRAKWYETAHVTHRCGQETTYPAYGLSPKKEARVREALRHVHAQAKPGASSV